MNLLKYNITKLVAEETRCDEDREIKLELSQVCCCLYTSCSTHRVV